MFVIAELVQLVQHGVTGFHRATLLNGLVYLIGVSGIIGAAVVYVKQMVVAKDFTPGARGCGIRGRRRRAGLPVLAVSHVHRTGLTPIRRFVVHCAP
jgi:hypothetical protein